MQSLCWQWKGPLCSDFFPLPVFSPSSRRQGFVQPLRSGVAEGEGLCHTGSLHEAEVPGAARAVSVPRQGRQLGAAQYPPWKEEPEAGVSVLALPEPPSKQGQDSSQNCLSSPAPATLSSQPLGCRRDAIFLLFKSNPTLCWSSSQNAGSVPIATSRAMHPQHLLLCLALDGSAERCKRDVGRGRQAASCIPPLQLRLKAGGRGWQRQCRGVAYPLRRLGIFEGGFKKDLNGTMDM